MAQIDWTTISTTANAYSTSISGTAVQHSTLSNPITSSGTWFRSFQSSANNTNAIAALIPINNALLTSSLGYPYGFTYSLRSWMRIDNPQANGSYIAMFFKGNSTLSAQQVASSGNTSNEKARGYRLILSDNFLTNQGVLTLKCASNEATVTYNSLVNPVNNTNGYELDMLSGSQLANLWIRARMDIMSLPDADRITIFTGSQAGNWSQIHQVDIQRTKTGAYVPWYNNPSYPSDNTDSATAGYMGIIHWSKSPVGPVRFDGFEVYREAITL